MTRDLVKRVLQFFNAERYVTSIEPTAPGLLCQVLAACVSTLRFALSSCPAEPKHPPYGWMR